MKNALKFLKPIRVQQNTFRQNGRVETSDKNNKRTSELPDKHINSILISLRIKHSENLVFGLFDISAKHNLNRWIDVRAR